LVFEQGVLTPEGKVEWNYQRARAAQAVRRVRGVRNVCNLIVLESKLPPTEFKREIEAAFRRNAKLDTNQIGVQAEGSNVTLRGTLRSWAAREVAERVTWTTPGVARVDNQT
jgi:osmotically-inducible protein OsmY